MPKKINKTFTVPKILPVTTNEKNITKKACVYFRFYDPVNLRWHRPFRLKAQLPNPYSKKEHFTALKTLADHLYEQLKDGWNPITKSFPVEQETDIGKIRNKTVVQAVQFAFDEKRPELKPKSVQDYQSTVKYLQQAARKVKIDRLRMADLELAHYQMWLQAVIDLRKLGAHGFNKYRTHLSALVTKMIPWQIVSINYLKHIPEKRVPKKSALHRPPTPVELNLIVARLKSQHYDYFRFVACVYATGIRPKELRQLRISDLNKMEQVFKIPLEVSKTPEEREAVIPDWLMRVLLELDLHAYPKDYFIFSKGFKPGPTLMAVNTPSWKWRHVIKKAMGIKVTQYAFKKLGGDEMIRLQLDHGIDKLIDLPQKQMGHTSSKTTEIYVNEHKEVGKRLLKTKMKEL